jgi:hypothetical protein
VDLPRFSLRSLFVLTATAAFFAAQNQWFCWNPEALIPSAISSIALLLFANGFFAKNLRLLTGGMIAFAVAVAVRWGILAHVRVWDGGGQCPLQVKIYDPTSNRPVSNATIWMSYGESASFTPVGDTWQTDASGVATIDVNVVASGKESLLINTSYIGFRFDTLFVIASGYQPLRIATKELIDVEALWQHKLASPIEINLEPNAINSQNGAAK